MKLAALADIHSNYYAFLACVEWIEKNDIDGIVFLGDYVSDCAEPQKTLKLIYELQEQYKTWFVRGNREDANALYSGYIENGYQGGKELWNKVMDKLGI